MDNDNEIKGSGDGNVRDLVEQSKLIFLREIIDEFRRKQAQYDLGREFAKTRKNRSPIVPLVVLGISLFFIIGAVAVTFYIQEMSKRFAVDIEEFEDINLRDVLDAAKRNEQDMERTKRDLASLESGMEEEIRSVRNAEARELEIIAAERISQEEKDRRSRSVRNRAAAEIRRIQESYAPRQAEFANLIADIQKKMDEYDTRHLEKASRQ